MEGRAANATERLVTGSDPASFSRRHRHVHQQDFSIGQRLYLKGIGFPHAQAITALQGLPSHLGLAFNDENIHAIARLFHTVGLACAALELANEKQAS